MRKSQALLATAILLLATTPVGLLQANPHMPLDDEWMMKERHVEFDATDEGFQATSTLDKDDGYDLITERFDLQTSTYDVSFLSTRNDPTSLDDEAPDRVQFKVTLNFVDLIVFEDVSNDGMFSPVSDPIQHRIPLKAGNATNLTITDNGTIHEATWTHASPEATLEATFHVASTPYTHAGTVRAPTLTSLDIEMQDHTDEPTRSGIALLTRLSSSLPLSQAHDGVTMTHPDQAHAFEGTYAWEQNLSDAEEPVEPLVIELPTDHALHSEANVLFSSTQTHGAYIGVEHDPSLHEQVLDIVGDWYLFTFGLFGSVLILGASLYNRLGQPPLP